MKEQLVSLEVARLAKEKGFNAPTIWYYHPRYGLYANTFHVHDVLENMNSNTWANGYFSAPTQSLLQKWLREECDQDVIIIRDGNQYLPVNNAAGMPLKLMCEIITNVNWRTYATYEEALEKGLFEALQLIK